MYSILLLLSLGHIDEKIVIHGTGRNENHTNIQILRFFSPFQVPQPQKNIC
jgi:hypothetical protein